MTSIAIVVPLIVLGFLAALASVVGMQILNGTISTRFLLYGTKADGTKYFSPERVQLLLFTIWTALSYLLSVMKNLGSSSTLPDISNQTLYLLSGSHAVYLGGKAMTMLRKP